MTNKIEVKNLKKTYDNFVLGEDSFEIKKGFITGFIGKNGMGKTTTIKSLLSLINYDGEVFVEGEDARNLNYLQDVGIIMDDSFLSKDWKISLVNEAMKCGYENWKEEEFFEYVKKFGIEKDKKVRELSRGMKIKLMLSIALSHEANLLILDEPTSGLDPSMRDELTDILKDFVEDENNTVLFSTHITEDLDRIADYIIFIDDGKIIDSSSKEEFLEKYLVLKGGSEDRDLLKDFDVLGIKANSTSFDALVKNVEREKIPEDLFVEEPDINKILVLYGRMK
ncbi:ABC transporter ATP-binding protein [Peptoniphilus harei]|uniref:Daunorubicin/doxorubicin resistance ATP-binding protein DrrA n=1 Tax=Peptoniphilus harei TaxID=54005 RepID=A0A2X1YHG5_9FIRM|nr:ABC transporter ATP-binding protein [Peptoniphilus harei]QQT90223.1 ABC transporter ATP-binding protein [Peptoniphilus harei]SPY46951.1 Daunorubicin/doxorubicin resistance ATP-binding protein DrrA [Peptoniphilus harei]